MRVAQSSEQECITSASNGDLEAFNQLVQNYQSIAYFHAMALVGDPDSADDIAQESFIKAFQNIGSFRGGSFRAWILRIVTNTSYDLSRRMMRRRAEPLFPVDENGEEVESPAWLADPRASVQVAVEQAEESKQIYQIVHGLPAAHRSVITLIDLYELDYTEAAAILHIPLGTVKSRLARARMQLKHKLQNISADVLQCEPEPVLS